MCLVAAVEDVGESAVVACGLGESQRAVVFVESGQLDRAAARCGDGGVHAQQAADVAVRAQSLGRPTGAHHLGWFVEAGGLAVVGVAVEVVAVRVRIQERIDRTECIRGEFVTATQKDDVCVTGGRQFVARHDDRRATQLAHLGHRVVFGARVDHDPTAWGVRRVGQRARRAAQVGDRPGVGDDDVAAHYLATFFTR